MADMITLLEELKRLDPGCFEDIRRRMLWNFKDDMELYNGPDQTKTAKTFRENLNDTIQGCIQRTIENRHWIYTLSYIPRKNRWQAKVFEDYLKTVLGESASIVVLRAYLNALKWRG